MKTIVKSYHGCAIAIFNVASHDMDKRICIVDVTCIDVIRTNNTTTRNERTNAVSSLVDVACIGVSRADNTATRDDNTCTTNTAANSPVDMTCIDVSRTDNTDSRGNNTAFRSLVSVTCIGVACKSKTAISIVSTAYIAFDIGPAVELVHGGVGCIAYRE